MAIPAIEAETQRPKRQKGDKAMAQEDPEEEPQAEDDEVSAQGPDDEEAPTFARRSV